MIFRGKAPLRISFSGGGTDVAPYYVEHGGAVLSAAINLYAYASLMPNGGHSVNIQSLDYDNTISFDIRRKLAFDGPLRLVKAVIEDFKIKKGFDLFLHCDAPPGTGLGSSGTVGSLLVALMKEYVKLPLTNHEIAERAIQIERVKLGVPGGKQDQFTAVSGGINLIEFREDDTVVQPLQLADWVVNELEYHLLLVYTRKKHYSGDLITTQVDMYKEKRAETLAGMHRLKAITYAMKDCLLRRKFADFGALLHEAWENKKRMNPKAATPEIDELYAEARRAGAIGGKLVGAGGGGYLLLFCEATKKHLVNERLRKLGAIETAFNFSPRGLQVWQVESP
jgi:D-glycero-alpha-D-manno-heptose-7-phosphate kinase